MAASYASTEAGCPIPGTNVKSLEDVETRNTANFVLISLIYWCPERLSYLLLEPVEVIFSENLRNPFNTID